MRSVTESFVQGTMTADQVSNAASRQYWARPADQRFDSLEALHAMVHNRRNSAIEFESEIVDMTAHRNPDGGIVFKAKNRGIDEFMNPTHWAFGQTCALVNTPAAYMRKLARENAEDLVVKNLNHCISKREKAGFKFLATTDDTGDNTTLYATTSPTYGRIWDADVVDAAKTVIDAQNGKFYSPWAWGKTHRALFGSTQDVFMYFIDGGSIVDGGGSRDQLNRGIYIWNSEVGAATFGIATFLFRETCGNFLVWGAQNIKILNVRHTSGGPQRFINEAVPALKEFAQTSVQQLEAGVRAAKAFPLPTDEDEIVKFGIKHGFTRGEVKRAIQTANVEEGQCATLWDLVNGFTATARMMAFIDARNDMETRAGKLMKLAESKAEHNAKISLA